MRKEIKEISVKYGPGVLGIAAALGAGIGIDRFILNPRSASVDGGASKTPIPVVTPGAFPTVTPDGASLTPRADATTVQPTRTPVASAGPKPAIIEVAKGAEIAGSLFSIRGVPDRVDANNVDTAKGGFKNTIPGTEHVLAEPGSLLVGPDFPQATIDQSGGHIDRFNPGNQYILQTGGPSFANVAEGAFMMASGASMNVEIGGAAIQLNGEKGRNWFLIVRGRFADGKQDSDLNLTANITKYVPGHVLISRHPAGAFISEGQFKQMAATSHDGGSNCGNEGCSRLSALLLDINTGAYSVVEQVGKDQPWKMVASNWK